MAPIYEWYERFRCVDFRQAESQLDDATLPLLRGLGLNCRLVVLDIESVSQKRDASSHDGYKVHRGNGLVFFPTGGFVSNCDPRGV